MVGKGGVGGTVYLGKLEYGKEVAIKILNRSSQQDIPEFLNEVNLLRRGNRVHLVRLLGCCEDEEHVLVYEFTKEGNIWDHFMIRITIFCKEIELKVYFVLGTNERKRKP